MINNVDFKYQNPALRIHFGPWEHTHLCKVFQVGPTLNTAPTSDNHYQEDQKNLIVITVHCQILQLLFFFFLNLGHQPFSKSWNDTLSRHGKWFEKTKQKKLLNLEGPGDMPSVEFTLKCENQCNLRLSWDHFYKISVFISTATNWNHLSNNEVEALTSQDYKQLITTPSTVQLLCTLFCHRIWNRSWEIHAQTPHVFQRLVPSFLKDCRRLEYSGIIERSVQFDTTSNKNEECTETNKKHLKKHQEYYINAQW